jgi:hypothetical protein
MNYTLNSWGNKYNERITEKDVNVIKK